MIHVEKIPQFDPCSTATWLARGRAPEHAEAIAKAWRDFPDLAPTASPEDRMARTCARAHDEVESEAEIQRCFPAARSLLGEQAIEKGCGVYPTHASPIQAQYAIRSLTVIFAFRHLDLASLLHA